MRGVIKSISIDLLICPECESLTTSLDGKELSVEDFWNMSLYLKSKGLEPTWDSIKIIEEEADV